MDNVQKSVERFRDALAEVGFDLRDLMDFMHESAKQQEFHLISAISGHIRDQMDEMVEGQTTGYADLVAEAYRRTFCDEEASRKYAECLYIPDVGQQISMFDTYADNLLMSVQLTHAEAHYRHSIGTPSSASAH